MNRYRELTKKEFESCLSAGERLELDDVNRQLEVIETTEADEIDLKNAAGRLGRLDSALDRMEEILHKWQATKA